MRYFRRINARRSGIAPASSKEDDVVDKAEAAGKRGDTAQAGSSSPTTPRSQMEATPSTTTSNSQTASRWSRFAFWRRSGTPPKEEEGSELYEAPAQQSNTSRSSRRRHRDKSTPLALDSPSVSSDNDEGSSDDEDVSVSSPNASLLSLCTDDRYSPLTSNTSKTAVAHHQSRLAPPGEYMRVSTTDKAAYDDHQPVADGDYL